jgi:hypothetical protein
MMSSSSSASSATAITTANSTATTANASTDSSSQHASPQDISIDLDNLSLLDNLPPKARDAILSRLNLQTHVQAHSLQSPSTTQSGSLFFDKISPELREMVYEYLLVNPELAKCTAISFRSKSGRSEACRYGADVKYGLTPSILAVCRQANEEAHRFLYEKNTFVVACLDDVYDEGKGQWYNIMSPLIRYSLDYATFPQLVSFFKNLRVIVDTSTNGHWSMPFERFTEFCRLVGPFPLKSLEILVLPQYNPASPDDYFSIRKVTQPLRFSSEYWKIRNSGRSTL